MNDFGLMPIDVTVSGEEARAAADARAAASRGGLEPEGRDSSRAVAVRFDRRGQVSAVEISTYWRDELSPAGLREALLTAYRNAFDAAVAFPVPIADEQPADAQRTPEPVHDDDGAWFDAVRRQLDETDERLARNAERLSGDHVSEREVSGPAGLVRLSVDGFIVTDVLIDARVALEESPRRIAADALAAFRAARNPEEIR